jgi:hypothetical protein
MPKEQVNLQLRIQKMGANEDQSQSRTDVMVSTLREYQDIMNNVELSAYMKENNIDAIIQPIWRVEKEALDV